MKIGKNQAKTAAACLALLAGMHVPGNARADESDAVSAERIQQLERTVELLRQELQAMKDDGEREARASQSRLSEAEVGTLWRHLPVLCSAGRQRPVFGPNAQSATAARHCWCRRLGKRMCTA